MLLVRDGSGAAVERDEEWLCANVSTIWLGVLVEGGAAGLHSKLTCKGMPAIAAPVYSDPITSVDVSINGAAPARKGIKDAIDMLGLAKAGRPWMGGVAAAQVRSTGALPGDEAVAAATVSISALVGDGQWALVRAAKLQALQHEAFGTEDAKVPTAAKFLAGLAGARELGPAIAIALAVPPGSTDEAEVAAAAATMRRAVGDCAGFAQAAVR